MTDHRRLESSMHARVKRLQRLWLKHFPIDRVLAQKIAKCTVNSTVAYIFCLIPEVRKHLGSQPAMLPLISVMVHPGRRIGGTIQAVMFCLTGLVFGLAYALLGRFLAQRCLGHSWDHLTEDTQYANHFLRYEAALAILAVFETFMLFFHGWMRSVSHHYFAMVFPLFLVVHFAFLDPLDSPISETTKAYTVPFYLGIAMTLFWNLVLFPEFGSTYLGNVTIDTMNLIHDAIDDSVNFFISVNLDQSRSLYGKPPESLSKLLKSKPTIHNKISVCSACLHECIYEISYSYLSPIQLKPIIKMFKPTSMYINGLINACQLEFTLLGRDKIREGDILHVETDKEITYANFERFDKVLRKLRPSIYNLHEILSESIYLTKIILAHAYDVNLNRVRGLEIFKDDNEIMKYKNKKDLPEDFHIDERKDVLQRALLDFDKRFREELLNSETDFLHPKDEMFLLSSFLMNFKEATNFVINLLDHSKEIYTVRKSREAKGWIRGKSVWFTFLHSFESFKIWIKGSYSKAGNISENEGLKGGFSTEDEQSGAVLAARRPSVEEQELLSQQLDDSKNLKDLQETPTLPLPASLSHDQGPDESIPFRMKERRIFKGLSYYFTVCLIEANRFCKRSKAHFRFGFQVTVALFLASFPMFVPKTRDWYIDWHGAWVGFVCILCMEPSVGGTFWAFFLRMLGVIIGSSWAYLSYAAGSHQSDPYLETVITAIGAAPGFYFFLGTPYVRAAIIGIISIYIVLLAAIVPGSVSDSILTAWAKRCFAVGYGGGVSLIVQLIMFPSKARHELNQEIGFVCGSISELQLLYASGLEGESLKVSLGEQNFKRMTEISLSARGALSRADVYKGLARQEPRLMGEYTELGKVFTQIIFVLRQILDRIDNAALLRKQYGSAVLEELNSIVYPYRRQVVASLCCLMRAIQEAFLSKTPLPQFLPSARIAQRRLINMVRRTLKENYSNKVIKNDLIPEKNEAQDNDSDEEHEIMIDVSKKKNDRTQNATFVHEFALKERFLSWNASTVAFEEIIEYVEELCNLTKILVGINEFKYGFLSRPLYEDWAAEAATGFDELIKGRNSEKQSPPSSNERQNASGSFESSTPSDSSNEEQQAKLLDLSRIATHKPSYYKELSPFRNRSFSLGVINDHSPTGLTKKKTLGDADSDIEDDADTSDSELPLALQKILTNENRKDNSSRDPS